MDDTDRNTTDTGLTDSTGSITPEQQALLSRSGDLDDIIFRGQGWLISDR